MSCSSCPSQNKRTNPNMLIQLIPGDLPKPGFLKVKVALPNERALSLRRLAKDMGLATVCQEAMCPNINECWGGGTATFMVMGDTCTRACKFCNVNHGKPTALDPDEPQNLAKAIEKMGLDYAVITCVDRDDLPDGGAGHFAQCISELRRRTPKLLIEVLTSDFQGCEADIEKVVRAGPHVFAHNVETVSRLQGSVRDRRAGYAQSLGVLKYAKKIAPSSGARKSGIFTKSSIMVGLGEKPEEVLQTMRDLRAVGTDFLTIGQYLRPTAWNLEVREYVPPEQFETYRIEGEKMEFKYVASGSFVRSSYKAGELYVKSVI